MVKSLYRILSLSAVTLGVLMLVPAKPAAARDACSSSQCAATFNNGIEVFANCHDSGSSCVCPLSGYEYLNQPCY